MLCWFLPYINMNQHRYMSPCNSWASLPPPTPSHYSRLSQGPRFELPASYSKFPLAIYFTYGNIYVSVLLSQFVSPSPSPTLSTILFFMSASPLLSCTQVHQYHVYRFHIYALIYDICLFLTSLCILGFRFIHLIRTDLNAFLFMAE